MAITRNALLTFAFALTVAASAHTAAAGAAKEIMAPANLKPEAARGFERLKGVEITDGEITAVDYGKSGLRVAFVLRPTPKSFIRCELGLADPSKWDGRFWGLGNGGWAGRVSCRRDGVTVYASTDLGTSQYPDRNGDAPREVLTDYAWRATHLMTVEAKKLVAAYYGRQPDRCYFRGASCGGRQGIVEAFRFPADYDGILSEVPGITERSRASHAWVRDRLKEKYRKWFTKEEIAAVREAELSYFKKIDPWWAHGHFILDPYPTKDRLDGCWAEILRRVPALADREEMWRKLFEPVIVNGQTYAPGRLLGVEFSAAWTFLLHKYGGNRQPILNTEDDLARFAAEPDLRIGHNFTDFKARGGKLIMYGGLEDLSCPEPEMREFYDAVLQKMGGIGEVSKFFAYYVVPGRSHGAKGEPSGPGQVGWPANGECVSKLVNWVEKGVAPGALNFVWTHETNKVLSITPYPANKVTYSESGKPETAKRQTAKTLPPAIANFEVRRNPALSGRRAMFYIDDVVWLFRDLARQRPESLFDNPFLRVLKAAHDKYGLKVQLNCFYRTDFFYGMDEFTLAETPDRYKAEWQANKDWLRLGFHSLQEFPDYPFINADYGDMKSVVGRIRDEVRRFAGDGVFTHGAVVHWGSCSKDACRALRDMGFGIVLASCGPRVAYGGDPSLLPYGHAMRLLQNRKPETCLYRRLSEDTAINSSIGGYNNLTEEQAKRTFGVFDYIYDREIGIGFKELEDYQPLSAGINLYALKDIPQELEKVIGRPFVTYSYHEQYFHKDYLAYQPDYADKVMLCAKMLHDAGYKYIFFADLAGVN